MRSLKNFHTKNITVGNNKGHCAQNIKYSVYIIQTHFKLSKYISSKIQCINMLYNMQYKLYKLNKIMQQKLWLSFQHEQFWYILDILESVDILLMDLFTQINDEQ